MIPVVCLGRPWLRHQRKKRREVRPLQWRVRRRARVEPCPSWLHRRSVKDVSVKCSGGKENTRIVTYLVSIATHNAAYDRLDSACGRIDVGLEGGSVLVRHLDRLC